MDYLPVLGITFLVGMTVGWGAALYSPRAIATRRLIGRLILSGVAGSAACSLWMSKLDTRPEDAWESLVVVVAAAYGSPALFEWGQRKLSKLLELESAND